MGVNLPGGVNDLDGGVGVHDLEGVIMSAGAEDRLDFFGGFGDNFDSVLGCGTFVGIVTALCLCVYVCVCECECECVCVCVCVTCVCVYGFSFTQTHTNSCDFLNLGKTFLCI